MNQEHTETGTNLGLGAHESSRFVDNDGVTLHYLDLSPSAVDDAASDDMADAPLIFSLGMTDIALDYLAIAEHTGRRTIVIDPRGQGLSEAPPSGYSLDHRAGDIDAVVNDAVGPDGDVHVMTFSRGSCYATWWSANANRTVRSLSIGDYPGREIQLTAAVADRLMSQTWRGTQVGDRVSAHAMAQTFAESGARPLWDEIATLSVPTLVVRSTAAAPIQDEDWDRYETLAGVERVFFSDSPHDIFRPSRSRFPELVAQNAAAGDAALMNGA